MTPSRKNLASIRHALTEAIALIDHLESYRGRRIDQGVIDLLTAYQQLSTRSITALLRRRRQDVMMALRLMWDAGQIRREGNYWKLPED
jgi:hypothetical protein